MKISEVINILQQMKKEHGDLEVWTTHEWSDILIEIEYIPESVDDQFHEYWPERVDVQGGGHYDHKEEYLKRIK